MSVIDIKNFSEQLKHQMNEQLSSLEEKESNRIERFAKSAFITKQINQELQNVLGNLDKYDPKTRILIYKEVIPFFRSQHYFFLRVFEIELNTSYSSRKHKLKCFNSQLCRMAAFILRNKTLYQYLKSGSVDKDEEYFLDQGWNSRKVSLMLTYEKLNCYDQERFNCSIKNKAFDLQLKWTGSKTSLIELIYGLQATGVFNNSVCDIKQIATAFEAYFDISLGNYYDVYQQIRIRKINQTKFLDMMKDKLLDRFEDQLR